MEAAHLRRPHAAGRRYPQPDAAGAGAPRADGLRAVRRPAAAAVHRQPSPQDAGRRRLGRVAARRHQPLLHAGARRARAHRRGGCGRCCASRSAGTAGADQDARRLKGGAGAAPDRSRRSSSRRRPGSGTGCARSCSARASHLQALPGLLDERWIVGDLGCGTGQVAAALAPFVAQRDRGRSLRRDAAGGAPAAARLAPTSTSGAASSRRCRSTTARSTRRRCCWCCTTCPTRPPCWPRRRACCEPGGRLLIADMLPHDREEYRQQMGHVWLGFGDDQLRRLLGGRRVRAGRGSSALAADPARQGPGAVRRDARAVSS